jgi:hypothetical protein
VRATGNALLDLLTRVCETLPAGPDRQHLARILDLAAHDRARGGDIARVLSAMDTLAEVSPGAVIVAMSFVGIRDRYLDVEIEDGAEILLDRHAGREVCTADGEAWIDRQGVTIRGRIDR